MRTQTENSGSSNFSTGEQASLVNSLHALEFLSRKVAAKSKTINSLIRAVDSRLAALNLEIAVWIEDKPLEAGEGEEVERDDGTIRKWRPVTLLGYCRLKNGWGLAVKEADFELNADEFERKIEIVTNSENARALIEADPQLQVAAIYIIPQLVEVLKKRAYGFLQAVKNTEKLVGEHSEQASKGRK